MISRGYSQQTCPMSSPDVSYTYDNSPLEGGGAGAAANDIGELTSDDDLPQRVGVDAKADFCI